MTGAQLAVFMAWGGARNAAILCEGSQALRRGKAL